MDLRNNQITIRELLQQPQARMLLQREFPQVFRNPLLLSSAQNMTLQNVIRQAEKFVPQAKIQEILKQLQAI
ncbi:hypothetical protein [Acidaminobacterium chupaoyuni]